MTWVERILATECTSHGVGAGFWCRQPVNTPDKSYVCASRIAAAEGVATKPKRHLFGRRPTRTDCSRCGTFRMHGSGVGYVYSHDGGATWTPGPDACGGRR